MEARITYKTWSGIGSHILLSTIPVFLKLHEYEFGEDVKNLEIDVLFKCDFRTGWQRLMFDRFTENLPAEPLFEFSKRTKTLRIVYTSKYPAFAYNQPFGSDRLKSEEKRGCYRFKHFLRELREVFSVLAPQLAKQTNFETDKLLQLIDKKSSSLPKVDAEIIKLEIEQRERTLEKEKNRSEPKPYRSKKIPPLIPVARYIGGSHYIGHYDGEKQFWGQVVASTDQAPELQADTSKNAWERRKLWHAVLHKFDANGQHLGTEHKAIGRTSDGEEAVVKLATETLEDYIRTLGVVRYGDIAIKLFKVEFDGAVFGMIETSIRGEGASVTMEPGDLVFREPWNGDYDS